jgi:hypothetical protein
MWGLDVTAGMVALLYCEAERWWSSLRATINCISMSQFARAPDLQASGDSPVSTGNLGESSGTGVRSCSSYSDPGVHSHGCVLEILMRCYRVTCP